MFKVKTLKEAHLLLKQKLNYKLEIEMIQAKDALGRVLSKDIISTEDVPAFNKSTVDGYACRYHDIKLASDTNPTMLEVIGSVDMGKVTSMKVKQGQAIYVPTGGFVPDGADVMVMIEHTELLQENVLIYKKHAIYQNMIKMGKDISKNTPFMKQYTRVTPRVIGALMSQNNKTVSVYKKLTFTVISTGDEITNKETITLGQVRDINTHTIAASIQSKHHLVNHTAVVQDDFEAYKNEIFKGFTHSDIVISSGGSSVGEKDYTHRILEEMGGDIFVHGLNIKPGKPTILAIYQDKLFIGLPGHPLSAYIILHLLLETILDIIYHTKTVQTYYEGTLSESVHNLSGRTLIQLVRVEEDNITPIYYKSAMINVLKDADGYIVIDQSSEGKYKGEIVKVYKLGD